MSSSSFLRTETLQAECQRLYERFAAVVPQPVVAPPPRPADLLPRYGGVLNGHRSGSGDVVVGVEVRK